MSLWFRMYVETVYDAKVQKLSPNLFKKWINFLCISAKNEGKISHISELSIGLRCTDIKADKMVNDLMKAGLIDRMDTGEWRPHNWDNRQYKSDVSKDRTRHWRERHCDVTSDKSVTRSESESESETDKNKNKNTSNGFDGFALFWSAYPKKVEKKKVIKWFKDKKPNASLVGNMIAAIELQKTSDQWQRGYIKNPLTWLNRGCWEDEPVEGGGSQDVMDRWLEEYPDDQT